MFSCSHICVEFDLNKGMNEDITLIMDKWTHSQKVDYDQLPFKCKIFHDYGHFARYCPKRIGGKN